MIKTKFVIAGLLVSIFCTMQTSVASQSEGKTAVVEQEGKREWSLVKVNHAANFDSRRVDSLPCETVAHILSFLQPQNTYYMLRSVLNSAGQEIQAMRQVQFDAAEYRALLRDPMKERWTDAQLFADSVRLFTPSSPEKAAIEASLRVEPIVTVSPKVLRVYQHAKLVDAQKEAYKNRREQRAQSSTWQRFSAILGGRCCRK